MAAAHQLPGPAGAELLDRAREAFTQGLQLSTGISAASAIAMAVLAAVLLRHVGAESEHDGQPDLEPGAAIITTGVGKIMEAVAETAASARAPRAVRRCTCRWRRAPARPA